MVQFTMSPPLLCKHSKVIFLCSWGVFVGIKIEQVRIFVNPRWVAMYLFTESPRRHCETVKQLFDVPSGQSRKRPGVPGVITYARAKKTRQYAKNALKVSWSWRAPPLHECPDKIEQEANIFWYAGSDQSWPTRATTSRTRQREMYV